MNNKNNILVIIPARGGSKGIPLKNIKILAGKPLIYYTIDIARQITSDENICVSTDNDQIIKVVTDYGLDVPFKRPKELATDTSSTNDVLLHALNFFENQGRKYNIVLLLQPTSPFRTLEQVKEAIQIFTEDIDMVVSVKNSHCVSILCSENEEGFLDFVFNNKHLTRQSFGNFYECNGAIYVINVNSLKRYGLSGFSYRKKYLMDEISSIDIDSILDWKLSEILIKSKI